MDSICRTNCQFAQAPAIGRLRDHEKHNQTGGFSRKTSLKEPGQTDSLPYIRAAILIISGHRRGDLNRSSVEKRD
jgi:hypothetical protein